MFFQQFPITSRYHQIETVTFETPDGDTIVYLRRRFLPDPANFGLLQEHTVADWERPDHLAATYFSDATQFWRLADANDVMHPDELTRSAGRKVRVTTPEGIPVAPEQ